MHKGGLFNKYWAENETCVYKLRVLISWQQRPCRLKFPGKEMRPRKQIKGNEIHRKLAGNYRWFGNA